MLRMSLSFKVEQTSNLGKKTACIHKTVFLKILRTAL